MDKLKFKDIQVPDKDKWDDISAEEWRKYLFVDRVVTIEEPVALYVSGSGGHFVIDAGGRTTYVKSSFIALQWKNRPGVPHVKFVKPKTA